ncbi:late embryogenesis abundant protein, LEA5-type [Artemisia annua]|uniref:Late embryogenesis abundant protein, LEA5-type n=1 Tax=Artemisia annua TaxID=35608 RepID=A0A2U1NQ45_ARTAN|nr:late embryogenesis abundant protein, LEA5-type [Artemisia annua]
MARGVLATTIKTSLISRRISFMTPKEVVARCMSKVARWNKCYDNEDEVQSYNHNVREQDKVYKEREESCWIPHPRTGIFYPKGQEGVMNEVPVGAASFAHGNYWLRDSDMY